LTASEEIILLEVLNASIKARRDYEDEYGDTKGKKRKRVQPPQYTHFSKAYL